MNNGFSSIEDTLRLCSSTLNSRNVTESMSVMVSATRINTADSISVKTLERESESPGPPHSLSTIGIAICGLKLTSIFDASESHSTTATTHGLGKLFANSS